MSYERLVAIDNEMIVLYNELDTEGLNDQQQRGLIVRMDELRREQSDLNRSLGVSAWLQ